jgi:primosomal protein N' (replication factor Y) (superfamily II helicase)
MSEFLEVVFNIPIDSSFTYLPPAKNPGDSSTWVGRRVIASFGRRKATGFVVGLKSEAPAGVGTIKAADRFLDKEPLFGTGEIELARWMGEMYLCSLGEALGSMLPGARRDSTVPAFPADEPIGEDEIRELSDEQDAAIASMAARQGGTFYLYGITGSGKTEVFLAAARRALDAGRGVIYLVPEISLTHQLIEAVRKRFPGPVAVLHSAMTPSQRLAAWHSLRLGETMIAVGARSAIFAPVRNLGLVIIDEEHEGSYKSSSAPRYHARQVAMKRCALAGASLVMGSATPSVEAWRLMETGGMERLSLTRRLSGGEMPAIRVVDMRGEDGCLSRSLVGEIEETKALGRQTILFLNRRGFSYFFHCRTCGYELKCRHCSVSLTFHKAANRMVCHYCGFSAPPPSVCPECGSLDVGYAGYGTEQVEETVRARFPGYTVRRVDTDSVSKKGELKTVLDEFRSGGVDILLGTQMVAKGLNFPGVRLVGVVQADTALQLPDFRSAERTFSLITQVAGRAGRFFKDGTVIVQTFHPEADAIRLSCSGRQDEFYAREIVAREALGFPPFSRIVRLVFRSKNGMSASSAAGEAVAIVETLALEVEVLGPAECPIGVIAGNHRYQILLKSAALPTAHRAARAVKEGLRLPADTYLEVDVDPVSLL